MADDLHPITQVLLASMSQPFREPRPRAPRPDAIRTTRDNDPVQVGPVQTMGGGRALYDCPCGCGLWTSEPAKRCGMCEELKPATHWDGLVECCGDCATTAYGD